MEINGIKLKNAINNAKSRLADYNDDQTIINSRKLWEAIRKIDKEADILEKIALDYREQNKRANEKLKAFQKDI